MTHFNHEWTDDTVAVPQSVGDRFYAQDLNDDFNYLKHLPYEVFLQGKSRGVMVTPNDTWDNDTNSLILSGGFGVVTQDCIELDPDEDFVIPPKTHSSPRYERIPFTDTVLILPNNDVMHYIVATPTKRSLLQRTKALFTEQYASRVRYDGVITIQDTAPTAGQILVGLCHNKEYCLLIDNNPDQCKDNIILKKWFGQNGITQKFVPALQSYYDTAIASIETNISIKTVNGSVGINGGTYNNCIITIGTVSGGYGIYKSTLNNCTITIETVDSSSNSIHSSTLNNCTITIKTLNDSYGINNSTLSTCTINIGTVSGSGTSIFNCIFNNCTINIETLNDSDGINGGTLSTCTITIGTVSNGSIKDGTFKNCIINIGTLSDINSGTYNNCTITIRTVSGGGINSGIFNNCTINIGTVSNGSIGIKDGTYNNCTINIGTVSNGSIGIKDGTFKNCTINIGTLSNGFGIRGGTYNNCIITIKTASGNSIGIDNSYSVNLNFNYIISSAVTDLSSTAGKLNILNGAVFHTS